MTEAYQKQLEAWAVAIETKTIDPSHIPAPSRDAVQIRLLERYKERLREADARRAARALAPAS